MNHQPKNSLDREIDEVLASIAAEEPRRVNAASVRRAMGGRRAASLPTWLAVAAILIIAFGAWMKSRSVAPTTPVAIARAPMEPEPARTVQPSAVSNVVEGASTSFLTSPRPKPNAIEGPSESPEGLPGIVIAAIERPEPLTTLPMPADALVILPIEIPALSVPTLSTGPEQPQENR